MKKILLSSLALFALNFVYSQVAKMPFIEHFTQASCGPCASQNPQMYSSLNSFGSGNYVKLTYQVSWPGTDPMNAEYPDGPATRGNYYGVNSVPDCSLNGGTTAAPTSAVNSSTLASAASETTPYQLSCSQTWGAGSSITVDIDVTNTSTTATNAADKIYVCMVEDYIPFSSSPGSNGETEFFYVARMFYNATDGSANAENGVSLPTIAAGATETFSFTLNSFPTYIRDLNQVSFVCFLQNNTSKSVEQAAKSNPGNVPGLLDVASSANSSVSAGYCDYSITPSIDFTNNGSDPITTVSGQYTLNGGAPVTATYNTAPINQGSSVAIDFPATQLSPGTSTIEYSITDVNNGGLYSNGPNMMAPENYAKLLTTGLPSISEGMETATLINGTGYSREISTGIFDADGIAESLFSILDGPAYNYGAIGGFALSNRSVRFRFFSIGAGESLKLIMQKVNLTSNSELTFSTAYRQYSSENDRLEAHISTDCGATWTSIFNEAGSTLAHGLGASSAGFTPNAASQWHAHVVDLSTYDNTSDVVIKFTGTSGYGNNLFLDDINIGPNNPGSVNENGISKLSIFPNPFNNQTSITFNVESRERTNIEVINALGQNVQSFDLGVVSGAQTISLDAENLANGLYIVNIMTRKNTITSRVTVNK